MRKDDPTTLSPASTTANAPKSGMDAFWMPFTANRQFKQEPRLLAKASGCLLYTSDAADE